MIRKSLTLAVFAALLTGSVTLGAEEVKFARGDIDGNGRFDAGDLVLCIEWMSGARPVPVIESLDVNRDGFVSLADVVVLFQYVQNGTTPQKETVKFVRGDLDGDGRRTVIDLRLLDAYVYSGAAFPEALDAADIDADGRIGLGDIAKLRDLTRTPTGTTP